MKNNQLINKVIKFSKLSLLITFTGFVTTLLVSYPYAEYFSLGIQVMAHILTIIFAAVFKIAVVLIMAASKEMRAINSLDYERTGLCCSPKY
jgi:hypothetical protein